MTESAKNNLDRFTDKVQHNVRIVFGIRGIADNINRKARILADQSIRRGIEKYLSFIWHDVSEEPEDKDEVFLVQWKRGYYDLTGYSPLTWRTIKRWAYLDDLIPTEDESKG